MSRAFNNAEKVFNEGRYRDAAAMFTQVIATESDNMNAYLRRGFCYSALKEYDKCIKDFTVVIDRHPNHVFAYISRGSAYNKLEQFNTAMIDFDMALNLEPESQEAYNNRGWAKNGLGLFKEACKDWKKSRKLGNGEAKIILKNNHCK